MINTSHLSIGFKDALRDILQRVGCKASKLSTRVFDGSHILDLKYEYCDIRIVIPCSAFATGNIKNVQFYLFVNDEEDKSLRQCIQFSIVDKDKALFPFIFENTTLKKDCDSVVDGIKYLLRGR